MNSDFIVSEIKFQLVYEAPMTAGLISSKQGTITDNIDLVD
jgi:hypothetical protein